MDAKQNDDLEKALDARGYKSYAHAGDAVGMTEAEKQEMDLRIELSNAIRARRKKLRLSQQELANRLGTSQARVSKIEWGKWDVPIDQMLKAYTDLGGSIRIICEEPGAATVNGHAAANGKAGKRKAKAASPRRR